MLALFPHATGTPAKLRPALVIQADFYNQRISNVLLAVITSNMARRNDAAHFFMGAETPEGRQAGLRQDSLVSCLNLAVITKNEIKQTVGSLPQATMLGIDYCLKAAMGIA